MTNVVVVDSDPVLLDNDGLIKPIQKISTKKPPSILTNNSNCDAYLGQ